MNSADENNASTTATTSPNEAESGPRNASESEYLQRQADAAKQAIAQVASDMSRALTEGVDPRNWTKEHPWSMVAAAAVAGFAAAATVVPSKQEQALRRLERIEAALEPKRRHRRRDQEDDGEDAPTRKDARGKTSLLGRLGQQVLEAIKPAIMTALTAGITARTAAAQQSGNGMGAGQASQGPAEAGPQSPASQI